jgi:aspartate kinase
MISTSRSASRSSCADTDLDDAVRAVHTAFGLDAESGEAVVYGGRGDAGLSRSPSSAPPVRSAP